MQKILVRNVKEEDIESIVEIQVRGWQTAYRGIVEDSFLDSINRQERIERRKRDYKENGFVVAELDGEVVGFCRYTDTNKFTDFIDGIDCEILALYVKPELKKNGIGRELFTYVTNEFKAKNKTHMIIWCLKDNEPSKKFYEKMGGIGKEEKTVEIGEKTYFETGFVYKI